ncbi:DNA topoisomerase IB [Kitasatospora sp. NPDC094028]
MRLRTTDPQRPGWRRVRRGRGFSYLHEDGSPVSDPDEVARLRRLAIPPAWREVWICPWPNGHLQALGTDAAGRRQYLYHPAFRAQREAAKHEHVLDVAARLPDLREQVRADLEQRGLCRERVLGCAARLLDLGLFRIGSDCYTRVNESFGLTTLRPEHVRVHRSAVVFDFPAKSGRRCEQLVRDPGSGAVVAALLRRREEGERLLAFWEHRRWHEVHGADLNAYLAQATGVDVTAKDFRTWHATVLAAIALGASDQVAADGSQADRRRAVARAVREVADYLGNTPAVCRASYINPRLIELFEQGRTIAGDLGRIGEDAAPGQSGAHGAVEQAVRELLGAY